MAKYYKVCRLPDSLYPYRGVQRLGPYPPDSEAENPVLFAECIRYFQSAERLTDLDQARILWNALGVSRHDFEIIGVDPRPDLMASTECLLGFDVVEVGGWNSLLSWDWFASGPPGETRAPNLVLMRVIFERFYNQLNCCRLFSSQYVANQFAEAAISLNKLAPDTFECSEAGYYLVVAVYKEVLV